MALSRRRRAGPGRVDPGDYNPRAAAGPPEGGPHPMPRRIVIALSKKTLALLDRNLYGVTRSWVIDRAIRTFFGLPTARTFKARMEEGYIANAERDRRLAEDWSPMEGEECGDWPEVKGGRRRFARGAGRSTTPTSTRRSGRRSGRRGRR